MLFTISFWSKNGSTFQPKRRNPEIVWILKVESWFLNSSFPSSPAQVHKDLSWLLRFHSSAQCYCFPLIHICIIYIYIYTIHIYIYICLPYYLTFRNKPLSEFYYSEHLERIRELTKLEMYSRHLKSGCLLGILIWIIWWHPSKLIYIDEVFIERKRGLNNRNVF